MNEGSSTSSDANESLLICARCLRLLWVGRGEFFVVQINAVADPSAPDLNAYEEQDTNSIRQAYEEVIGQLGEASELEANEQVARQLQIHLCNECFPDWFENPASK